MSNDLYRLNAVNRFKELDVTITNDLNDIVNLVARVCNTPVVLITLLDDDKQWFKASVRVDIDCTDRELSFCNYTIKQQSLLIVPDLRLDKRFMGNPLVTGEPFVRFYGGAALTTKDGYAIGSLCVIDFEPRSLDEHQQNSLKVLSKQVMNLMELNWSLRMLEQEHGQTQKQKEIIEESALKLNAIFNSSKHTHILVNKALEVIAFNRASATFINYVYGKTIRTGTSVLKYIDKEAIDIFARLFEAAFTDKVIKMEWHMRPGTKYDSWKEMEFVPIKNDCDKIIGVALNATDITDRKLQEQQINIQNEALTRIAIIQSHEIRRPVASLLGIMGLIKMEQGNATNYIDMLEFTVKELDERICEIVRDSENTLNNHLAVVA